MLAAAVNNAAIDGVIDAAQFGEASSLSLFISSNSNLESQSTITPNPGVNMILIVAMCE